MRSEVDALLGAFDSGLECPQDRHDDRQDHRSTPRARDPTRHPASETPEGPTPYALAPSTVRLARTSKRQPDAGLRRSMFSVRCRLWTSAGDRSAESACASCTRRLECNCVLRDSSAQGAL